MKKKQRMPCRNQWQCGKARSGLCPCPFCLSVLHFSNNKYRNIDIMLCYTVAVLESEDMMFLFLEFSCHGKGCVEKELAQNISLDLKSIITPISICKLILFLLTLYIYNLVCDFEKIFSLFRWIRSEKKIFFHSLFH